MSHLRRVRRPRGHVVRPKAGAKIDIAPHRIGADGLVAARYDDGRFWTVAFCRGALQ